VSAAAASPPGASSPGAPDGVLVTGASTGIGRACALRLARRGFRVFAGVRRDGDAASLRAEGVPGVEPVRLDVTDEASIAAMRRTLEDAAGEAGLAGVVNNAGIAVAGMLEFLPLADLRRQLEVNVVGLVAVTQACLPLLRRRGEGGRRLPGRVVLVGSSSGYLATPVTGAYAASKFAVEAIADALRMELRPWQIPVALVQPGAIATPIWDKSNADADARLASLPEEGRRLYAPLIESAKKAVGERAGTAISADTVAQAVEHALTSSSPRTRYRVGMDARLQLVLARLLPDRLRDRVLSRFLQL
jgi:NAD(P)-dependent dehydrogenase (short-subunit alcohol dehydrogenase family)